MKIKINIFSKKFILSLIMILIFANTSWLIYIAYKDKDETPKCPIHNNNILEEQALNERLKIMEEMRNFYENRSGSSVDELLSERFPCQQQQQQREELKDFWMDFEKYEKDSKQLNEIFINRNKNHSTCLVTTKTCKHHYKILILITTHANHFERREIIRKTWGADPLKKAPRWKTMFLIGRPGTTRYSKYLLYELMKHEDIILGDVKEDFYQLAKKIQMGFEWSVKYCSYDYLFKGDDDVFINLPRLFSFLNSKLVTREGVYAGNVQYAAKVRRKGRYAISEEAFNKDIYPRYCSGGGFILSIDVVKIFISIFPKIPVIKIDDAYVGMLALKAGVDVIKSDDFQMDESEIECKYNDRFIAHHPVKTTECMRKLFNENLVVKHLRC